MWTTFIPTTRNQCTYISSLMQFVQFSCPLGEYDEGRERDKGTPMQEPECYEKSGSGANSDAVTYHRAELIKIVSSQIIGLLNLTTSARVSRQRHECNVRSDTVSARSFPAQAVDRCSDDFIDELEL